MPTPTEDSATRMDAYYAQYMKEKKERERKQRRIQQQISQLYPEEKFSFLSSGSSAMIFRSRVHPELVFKHFLVDSPRDGESSTEYLKRIQEYAAEEVAMLVFLNSHGGWAPKVDLERTQLGIDHPTVVMEYIKAESAGVAPLEARQAFEELAELLSTYGISAGDVEPVYDKKSKRIRVIDAGGFTILPEKPSSPEEKEALKAKNYHHLISISY
jgi:hypothetical protein